MGDDTNLATRQHMAPLTPRCKTHAHTHTHTHTLSQTYIQPQTQPHLVLVLELGPQRRIIDDHVLVVVTQEQRDQA